jgi:hypothetical protein
MFSSTLRWFENLKFIFSGATRPIRRGAVFGTARLRNSVVEPVIEGTGTF